MSRASVSRIGQRVKIVGRVVDPFHGKTGVIAGIECGMCRVRLDAPVVISGIEPITDDLWEGGFLKTVRR